MPALSPSLFSICPRYPFYALNIAGRCPPFLHWLRYTAFIVLYPLGFVGELATWIVGLPHIKVGLVGVVSISRGARGQYDGL